MKPGGAIGMVGLSGQTRDPFFDNGELLWSQPSQNHTGFGLLSMHGKEMHYSHVNLNDDSDFEVGNVAGGGGRLMLVCTLCTTVQTVLRA